MANEYVTASQLEVPLGIKTSGDETWLGIVATGASRAVDLWCNRRFYADTNATARVYRAENSCTVLVDDISTTTGLIVATSPAGDGTFGTTWATTDYELLPLNGVRRNVAGWPYTSIRAVAGNVFPWYNARASVQVTAKWGFPGVPAEVIQACYILGAELYKRKDSPLGVAGLGDFGVMRIREDFRLATLLKPYVRDDGVAG